MSEQRATEPHAELLRILDGDAPPIERLARAFGFVTGRAVDGARRDGELARAMQDPDSLLRSQIVMSTITTSREIFQTCYRRITGRDAWHDGAPPDSVRDRPEHGPVDAPTGGPTDAPEDVSHG
jgi:hypothetical protein